MFVILTPSQIQYGGFIIIIIIIRASMKKIRDMIRDRARILYLIFLWFISKASFNALYYMRKRPSIRFAPV